MKQALNFILILLLGNVAQGQVKSSEELPFAIGEILSIESDILEESRIVNVYLPQSFSSDSLNTYPVIYLLDGSSDEDFIHISGLVQFCSFPWINTIPESIVVGIANSDRKRDFTFPSSNKLDQEDFPTSGASASFIRFIQEELMPYIEEKYRISETTLIGQSLGGLLACEILLKYPDTFNNYIIVSPSLWWDDNSLLKDGHSYLTHKSVFVGVGKEGDVMEGDAEEFYDKLVESSPENQNIHFGYFENRDHGDALHEAVYRAFEVLFNR